MEPTQEIVQIFVRRFGLLNASCCDQCCDEQVSLAQSHILFEVRRLGGPSMQQVAAELGMDITTFSRQVKGLEGKGLLARRVSLDDRRVSLLGVTRAGLEVLERIDRFMADRLEQVFSRMSPFERQTVVGSLGLLNEAMGAANQEVTVACCK